MRDSKYTSVVLNFGILILGVFALTACSPPGARACLDGDRLTRQGNYAEAIQKLKTATALLPRDPRVWNLLGIAYHKNGQVQDAFNAYRAALQRDSGFASSHYNLGCLYFEQNQFQNAITELTEYTKLEPKQYFAWMKLGVAHLRDRQFDQAGQCYWNAAQLKSDSARALNDLAVVEIQRRHPQEALNYFQGALSRNPAYAPALLNMGIVSHKYFNDGQGALRHYRGFLKVSPDPNISKAVDQVVARLEVALAPPPPPKPTNAPVKVAVVAPKPEALVPETPTNQPAIKPSPSAVPEKTNVVEVAAVEPFADPAPEPPAATNVLEQVAESVVAPAVETVVEPVPEPKVEVPPTAPIASEPPETVPVGESQPAVVSVALPVEEEIVPVAPPEELPREVIPDPALESVETARQTPLIRPVQPRDPKWRIPGVMNPARWFRSGGESASARGDDEPATRTEGDSEGGNQPLASGGPSNPVASRVPEPEASPEVSPEVSVPEVQNRLIRVPRYNYHIAFPPPEGDRSKALVHFSEGLRLHRERRLTQAIEAYRKAVEIDPGYFEAYYNLGLVAYDLKDLPTSLRAYEVALKLNPESADARYNFGLALHQGGFHYDAALELERILTNHPGETRTHLTLAKIYSDELFQTDLARRHYQQVLRLAPQHPQAAAIRYWLAEHP
jgi:tetratricopeptide (TPR) repeat protein